MTSQYRKFLMIYRYKDGTTATAVLSYPDTMPRAVCQDTAEKDAERIGKEVGAISYITMEAQ